MMRLWLGVLVGVCLIFSVQVAQACEVPVDDRKIDNDTILCTGNYTITDSGSGGILIINASNLTLDCNGANITRGPGGNPITYGIRRPPPGVDNVTIKNCIIDGAFVGGMYFQNVTNFTIRNNTFLRSDGTCLTVRGVGPKGGGVYEDESRDVLIETNYFGNNCLNSIEIDSGPDRNVIVRNNTIRSTRTSGGHRPVR